VLALLAVTAFSASQHLLNNDRGRSSLLREKGRSSLLDDKHRTYLSTKGWPLVGQGAYVIGNARPAASPHEQPVPIASVAKVMTAYLVLKHYPLRAGDSGRRLVVGQGDVSDTETRRRGNQSVVAVRAGEQLTERDA
jgi:D-alanyl-D-alanine carboxypeptidase (penicillin-binding protein 5/6)